MAKPLGPKSLMIREAIKAHPKLSPKDLAEMINASPARKEDRIEVKPGEISQQKQMMKKADGKGESSPAAPARAETPAAEPPAQKRRGRQPGVPTATRATVPASAPTDVVSHIEAIREAVRALGVEQVRRIVQLFE